MKVRLSEKELYEFQIPEVIEIQDLPNILSKLNALNEFNIVKPIKPLSSTPYGIQEVHAKKGNYTGRAPKRKWCDTREKAIAVITMSYYGTQRERDEFCKFFKEDWVNVSKSFHNLKDRYNLKPQEVGLQRFLKQSDGRDKATIEKTKLPYFRYKQDHWKKLI
jgi:hypothetical protein